MSREPWGEDVIYHFHRQLSLVAVSLVLTHAFIQFVAQPELFTPLNIFETPWGARFAVLSVCSLIALVVMALWRAKLKIGYETWHLDPHRACRCRCDRLGSFTWWGGASI